MVEPHVERVRAGLLLVVLASVFAGLAMALVVGAAVTGTPLVLLAAVPLAATAGMMWYHGTGRLVARLVGEPRARRRRARTTVGGTGASGAARRGDAWGAAHGAPAGRRATDDDERDVSWADGWENSREDPWEDPFWREVEREARTRARREAQRRARRREADARPGDDARRRWRRHWTGDGARGDRDPDPTAGRGGAAEAYRVLGLEPGAGQEAIREAFREKAKALHPDAEDGDAEAFKRVQEAYERLSE